MTSIGNQWVISWLVIDYWRWSKSNRSPKILWPIDYSSMTHRWPIDCCTAHERNFSCFLVPFFSFVILLSVLDASSCWSVETQSASHKYRWSSIVQFAKLNNLDGATVKVWSNKNGNWKMLGNLSSMENGLPLSQWQETTRASGKPFSIELMTSPDYTFPFLNTGKSSEA